MRLAPLATALWVGVGGSGPVVNDLYSKSEHPISTSPPTRERNAAHYCTFTSAILRITSYVCDHSSIHFEDKCSAS